MNLLKIRIAALLATTLLILPGCGDDHASRSTPVVSIPVDDDLVSLAEKINRLPWESGLWELGEELRRRDLPAEWVDYLRFRNTWITPVSALHYSASVSGRVLDLCVADDCLTVDLSKAASLLVDDRLVRDGSFSHGSGLSDWGAACVGDEVWVYGVVKDVVVAPEEVRLDDKDLQFRWLTDKVLFADEVVGFEGLGDVTARIELGTAQAQSVGIHC